MTLREIDARTAHDEMSANPALPYLDVRTPQEFAQGHPEGAFNVPILFAGMMGMKPNPAFLDAVSRLLPKEAPVIVGCKSGQRSAMACQILAQAGFAELANVSNGYLGPGGWAPSGLPSSREPRPGRAWAEIEKG